MHKWPRASTPPPLHTARYPRTGRLNIPERAEPDEFHGSSSQIQVWIEGMHRFRSKRQPAVKRKRNNCPLANHPSSLVQTQLQWSQRGCPDKVGTRFLCHKATAQYPSPLLQYRSTKYGGCCRRVHSWGLTKIEWEKRIKGSIQHAIRRAYTGGLNCHCMNWLGATTMWVYDDVLLCHTAARSQWSATRLNCKKRFACTFTVHKYWFVCYD